MKKLGFLICFLISFLFVSSNAYALVMHEMTGTIFKGNPVYDSENDRYILNFNPENVDKIYMAAYTDNTFTKVSVEKVFSDSPLRPFTGVSSFRCNVAYSAIYFDGSDNILGTIKFEADEIANGTCNSDNEQQIPSSSNETSCSAAICECINDLGNKLNGALGSLGDKISNSIDSVNNSVNNNGNKLDQVNTNLDDLKEVVTQIRDELKTDIGINEPTEVPVPPIISDGLLDENKPQDTNTSFEDNNTYFEDKGDAENVGPLPTVPEPEECWTNVGNICREDDLTTEDELSKENELSKDNELSKEDELQKNEFEKDEELKKDDYTKDEELHKDNFEKEQEMDKDIFQKDDVLQKDHFENSEIYNQDNFMNQDNFYQQTWW